jgi:hypothetical protein
MFSEEALLLRSYCLFYILFVVVLRHSLTYIINTGCILNYYLLLTLALDNQHCEPH